MRTLSAAPFARRAVLGIVACGVLGSIAGAAESLPFGQKVEVFRDADGQTMVFALRLEQPFLAEEFEKSNYLRLESLDHNSYLIYPAETRFHQKHAEFFGRLRGMGAAKLRLSYETVAENLDGSRKADARQGDIEVPIPAGKDTAAKTVIGSPLIFRSWAEQQNAHFRALLDLYPDQSFFQYVLLQSQQRYGVQPPSLPKPPPFRAEVEPSLYDVTSGALAVHEMLQPATLTGPARHGDLNTPIEQLAPPEVRTLDYRELLAAKAAKKIEPKRHDIAQLVPADQYFLYFHTPRAAGAILDMAAGWGDSLLRLFTLTAQDNRVQQKLEEQLCMRRSDVTKLFADQIVADLAITGSDPFVLEGTDVTVILRLRQPAAFQKAAEAWAAVAREKHPDLVEQQFNYRGHRVTVRYTPDRSVSSFVAAHGPFVIYSNSHRAIRNVIDATVGSAPRLYDAPDYAYVTTILPPSDDRATGYLFASEAFVRRMISPAAKIAEKRRLECFNNLVMINNASLMFRMEYGRGPKSLSELIDGRFIDADKIVCPHGGAYAIDTEHDTCNCSLHNRLKYLTPNCELPVYKVSAEEEAEYRSYEQRYEQFWQRAFDPIAVRITAEPRVKLETCVLPMASGGIYQELRSQLADKPQPIDVAHWASSAVLSCAAVPGRKAISRALRDLPGVAESLDADPTLADLEWLGDRVSLHFCDADTVLQIDPTLLKTLDLPLIQHVPVERQVLITALLSAATMPTYVSVEVEDRDKAGRLLEQLARQVLHKDGESLGSTTSFDAYRLPDYKQHRQYVFSFQWYAIKLRLHVALVGNHLVAATKPYILQQAIDAEVNPTAAAGPPVHLLVRLNRQGLERMRNQLDLYWAEKSRVACHRNAIAIYNFVKIYETPIDEVARLSEAKYGVRYFCPEHGRYEYDAGRDVVTCSIHGDRSDSRQNEGLEPQSSFAHFLGGIDQLIATARFEDDALIATVEIVPHEERAK